MYIVSRILMIIMIIMISLLLLSLHNVAKVWPQTRIDFQDDTQQ